MDDMPCPVCSSAMSVGGECRALRPVRVKSLACMESSGKVCEEELCTSMEGPLCTQGPRGLEATAGLRSLLFQLLLQIASHPAQPGSRKTGVWEATAPPLDPLPSPTMDRTMGFQARGMMVRRTLSAVLRSPQPGRRAEAQALSWPWGRESLAPSVCPGGVCSLPCAGPIRLALLCAQPNPGRPLSLVAMVAQAAH